MSIPLSSTRSPQADVAALAYAAAVAGSVTAFGFSLPSVGVPAALLLLLLADGVVRPSSNLLYPTVTHGPRARNRVALSFDDGPDPQVTPAVLDALAQYGARATFFTIGRALQAHPQLARRMATERHELGNHSWAHSRWLNFLGADGQRDEIERGAKAITLLTGSSTPPLYRPPMGLKSPPLAEAARQLNITVVAWSLHSHDTLVTDPERIAQHVLSKIQPGDIVLMHDGHDTPGRHRPGSAQALPRILRGLRDKGLECVTISELLQASDA